MTVQYLGLLRGRTLVRGTLKLVLAALGQGVAVGFASGD